MKRLLLLLVAIVGMAGQSMAQTNIKALNFSKVLKVMSKGINVREAPSTQSAKIGNGPELLLVINEDNEWYHAYIVKNGEILPKAGYVSKKVCKVKTPPIINDNYVKKSFSEQGLDVTTRKSGKYRDMSVITFGYFSLGWEELYCFIGKPVGNCFIGNLYYYESDGDDVRIERYNSQKDNELTIPSERLGGAYEEDLGKLTDSDIDELLSFNEPNQLTILYADKVVFEYRSNGAAGTTIESGNGVTTIDIDYSGVEGEIIDY